jgi:hypothetical protein
MEGAEGGGSKEKQKDADQWSMDRNSNSEK